MTPFVVDTNVAIVANGRGTHADLRCQLSCVERLKSVAAGEVVAIDDRRLHSGGIQKAPELLGHAGRWRRILQACVRQPIIRKIECEG